MTRAFSQIPSDLQFANPISGIVNFLARFDAIFTLNQDTLIEQQYFPAAGQDIAVYRPGIVRALDSLTFGRVAERIELYKPDETLTLLHRSQPYIKLHGSIDIMEGDREMMLVIGGNKPESVAQQPLLKWYHDMF